MKRSQLLFVATLFVSVLSAAPLHYPPANEHPRLFLRQQHVASLRQKFTDNRMAPIRTALLADTRYVGSDTTRLRRCFEANALFYILQVDTSTWQPLAQQNPLFARQAITGAVSLLESVTFPNDINGYRDAGRMEVAASIVYDWCFDQLTPSERTALRTGILRLAREENEYSYPPVNPDTIFGTGAITGHSSENILMRDLLCAGIALYDENPAIYNWAGGQLFDYFVPARNFAYRAQRHYQGDSYSSDRFEFEILVAWIFLRMGYDDVFISEQGKIPYQWIYSRRPDGQLLRDGDTYKSSRQTGVWWEYGNATDLLAAAYYQDSYIQGSQYTPSSYTNEATNIWRVLFRDIDLSSRAVTELPLTKYFPSPAGSMIARTGWDTAVNFNSSNVVAEMKVKEYQFNNHHHMDIGAFQMYYKGALAIDAGIYQSTVSSARYDSEHDQNFNKRTIAHNCMLVYDPAETVYTSNRAVVNDGGQRTPGNGLAAQTLNNLLNDGYNTGQVLGYGFGPDAATPEYSYLKGDIARAYTSKVSRYHRAFVFLDFFDNQHPAALIVYDRITSSNATFAKYWLLHCIEEPEINGTVTTIRRTQAMRNDAGTIVGTYNGKMVHHVLLPEASNAAIQKLGGPGHDFDVLGTNYPYPTRSAPVVIPQGRTLEPGAWQIRVSPLAAAATNHFLNVMQVMDSEGGPNALDVEAINTDTIAGARIAGRVVTFAKGYELISAPFAVKATPNGAALKYLVTDLAPGSWIIQPSNGESPQRRTVDTNGILYFTGQADSYTLSRQISETPVTLPADFNVSLAPVAGQGGQFQIVFGPVQAGWTYTAEYCTDLAAGNWLTLSAYTKSDNGPQRTITDLSASGARRFYRIRATPAP